MVHFSRKSISDGGHNAASISNELTQNWSPNDSTDLSSKAMKSRRKGRVFFTSDLLQNMNYGQPATRSPLSLVLGFTQQNMQTMLSMLSFLQTVFQLLLNTIVIVAVKQFVFSDLNEADRENASNLSDIIMNILNVM